MIAKCEKRDHWATVEYLTGMSFAGFICEPCARHHEITVGPLSC